MNEQTFKDEIQKAISMQKCAENKAFWIGYELGLDSGYYGPADKAAHNELLNVPKDCRDKDLLETSKGYRAGLEAIKSGIPLI